MSDPTGFFDGHIDGGMHDGCPCRACAFTRRYATPTFEQFMAAVNAVMAREYGITSRDIADWSWYDAFESGETPVDAAMAAVANDFNS